MVTCYYFLNAFFLFMWTFFSCQFCKCLPSGSLRLNTYGNILTWCRVLVHHSRDTQPTWCQVLVHHTSEMQSTCMVPCPHASHQEHMTHIHGALVRHTMDMQPTYVRMCLLSTATTTWYPFALLLC
jgi:hypothetical protein